jgi:hypothetical protein
MHPLQVPPVDHGEAMADRHVRNRLLRLLIHIRSTLWLRDVGRGFVRSYRYLEVCVALTEAGGRWSIHWP